MATSADTRARYNHKDLTAYMTDVFKAYQVPAADAQLAADVLIDADLSGIESHGIAHISWHPGYVPGIKRGVINPAPQIKVVRETPSTAALDGDSGLGVVVGPRAMEICMEKAEKAGIGMVTVKDGRHFGAAGYYAARAAERGLVGMAMCNVPPIAVPAGGLDRVYGTNPIAFGVPVKGSHPLLVDIATTAVAGGKLEIAQRQGKRLPAGWAVNADGSDSDDPESLRHGGALLPLGSRMETSSHKGYALAVMVDVLSGILSDARYGMALNRERGVMGQWFAAWRIDAFRDPAEFAAEVREMVDRIRATRPVPGVERVLVPGDPEAEAKADRLANGVPLDEAVIAQLTELGTECGVLFPAPRR